MSRPVTKGRNSPGKGQQRTERQAADRAAPGSENPWAMSTYQESAIRMSDKVAVSHVKTRAGDGEVLVQAAHSFEAGENSRHGACPGQELY